MEVGEVEIEIGKDHVRILEALLRGELKLAILKESFYREVVELRLLGFVEKSDGKLRITQKGIEFLKRWRTPEKIILTIKT